MAGVRSIAVTRRATRAAAQATPPAPQATSRTSCPGPIPPSRIHPDAPLGAATGHDRFWGRYLVSSGPYMIGGAGKIDFSKPPREHQWTRDFQEHGFVEESAKSGERVRAKGDLSRRRTIVQDGSE